MGNQSSKDLPLDFGMGNKCFKIGAMFDLKTAAHWVQQVPGQSKPHEILEIGLSRSLLLRSQLSRAGSQVSDVDPSESVTKGSAKIKILKSICDVIENALQKI